MERKVLCIFEDVEETCFYAFTSKQEEQLERFNGYYIGATDTPTDIEQEMINFFYQSENGGQSRYASMTLAELRDFSPNAIYFMGCTP